MKTLTRTLNPEVRVIDQARGIVEYVASDETCDSYREIIRASGWKFDNFQKNAPFVDSHDYSTIKQQVGKVIDFKVVGKNLVETVQWAIDVAANELARYGFDMTAAGYLKAVSVGFYPESWISKWDADNAEKRPLWLQQLKELGLTEDKAPRTIYLAQQQIELSSCIIGANPNALARAYKAGVLNDAALDFIGSKRIALLDQFPPGSDHHDNPDQAGDPAVASSDKLRARTAFLLDIHRLTKRL